ncbi:MAG TPA: FIST N-terminal domain-containing protein, partial [Nannocystis sp.]
MTDTIVVYTSASDSDAAARELCERIAAEMPGAPPDALILFASPQYDQPALLRAMASRCNPKVMVGASSAGEFTSETNGTGLACALAL